MTVALRPYQSAAIDAVNDSLATDGDYHPCVSIPTAGGKTIIFAEMIRRWFEDGPLRVLILAHRQELLVQAEAKIKRVWPEAKVGIWSAALNRKEGGCPITIGGVASIYRRAYDLDPFDVCIVDECHLLPNTSDTMYRSFLADCRKANPKMKIVGFTATPYRLDGGMLCGPDRMLTHVCYEADIISMIEGGFICPLITQGTETSLPTGGVRRRGGDYIPGELEDAVDRDEIVRPAVAEIVRRTVDRKSILIFCCGVKHARHVVGELKESHGITAPLVIGETEQHDRAKILADFDAGRERVVVNVNCLTTGLDVTRIDCIAVLRPTESTSLWVQMVGRGFRLHPGKENCLILDFGANTMRHGPLTDLRIKKPGDGQGGEAPAKKCPQCGLYLATAIKECPACGFLFPEPKPVHDVIPDSLPLIVTVASKVPDAKWFDVKSVRVENHFGKTGTPSMRVTYGTGLSLTSEWICFEHDGFARSKAVAWWKKRFTSPAPQTVREAVELVRASGWETNGQTLAVKIQPDPKNPKYMRIVDYRLGTPASITTTSTTNERPRPAEWISEDDIPF